ncbi:MAG: hypothetical protein LBF58_09350, partial [Deltaproteobacteria bacterium]|nr:hypothetical protein [Deltaproteobacteria bacterium]
VIVDHGGDANNLAQDVFERVGVSAALGEDFFHSRFVTHFHVSHFNECIDILGRQGNVLSQKWRSQSEKKQTGKERN